MARYRKIYARMYADRRYTELSNPQPCGRFLWHYLLTGPHTGPIPGLSCIGEAALAEAIGWPMEGFRQAFRELSRMGMAKADWTARVLWLPEAIADNPPESPNVITSWGKNFEEIPACSLRDEAMNRLEEAAERMGKGFYEAFKKAFPKDLFEALPKTIFNQEQKQEQEPEQDQDATAAGEATEIEFPVKPSGSWSPSVKLLRILSRAFPAVNLNAECHNALAWLEAKRSRLRMADGMEDFLRLWMKREVSDPRNWDTAPHRRAHGRAAETIAEFRRRESGR